MSKIIGRSKEGSKIYLDALSPKEIREADEFLTMLQREIAIFEKELCSKYSPSSLEYKFYIGKFLSDKVASQGITSSERLYVFEEIKNWVQTGIETSKDRGAKRQFYDYCYRLYCFGEEIVFSFTWRQWSEFLDRSVTTKDVRVLNWLKDKKKDIKEDDFRMFLLVLNEYLKNRDTTVFEEEDLYKKYETLFEIVVQWNNLLKKYFGGKTDNFTKARKANVTKYKKKYVSQAIAESKFKDSSQMAEICERIFVSLFVDIDTSGNFKKGS